MLAYHINPKNGAVLKLMGMANVMLGQLSAAIDAFQRGLAINKGDDLMKKMLNETVDLYAEEGVAPLLGPVEFGVSRKNRVAKGPPEASRLSARRSVARKSPGNAIIQKTPDFAGECSSAMDMSLETPGGSSFIGDFRSAIAPVCTSSTTLNQDVSIGDMSIDA